MTRELALQKLALLFLSKLPDRDKVSDLLSRISARLVQTFKDQSNSSECESALESYHSLCMELVCSLQASREQAIEVTDRDKLDLLVLQIWTTQLDCYVNLSKFDDARKVLNLLKDVNGTRRGITSALCCVYEAVLTECKINRGDKDDSLVSSYVENLNEQVLNCIHSTSGLPELKMLQQSLTLFFHLCGSKVQHRICSDVAVVRDLCVTCSLLQKLHDVCVNAQGKKDKSSSPGKGRDDLTKIHVSKCQAFFRKLQFTLMLVQAHSM